MGGLFYNLGRLAGPKVRKGKWVWRSLTGDEAEILAAEEEVGRDLAAAFAHELGVETDPDARRYVSSIGTALAKHVSNKQRTFHFTIAAAGDPNAFALPGGRIFVSRSLIELIDADRDRLAFLLGHEMAHVIKQHPMERIVSDAALSTAMRTVRVGGLAGRWVRSTGARLMQSAYSQDRELLADKLGARLAQSAGFDPRGSIRLMEQLKEITRASNEPLSEYFSTHPPFDLRIQELQQFLDQQNPPSRT